jgi:putative spermidine/putrescine transport system permease protein
VGAVSAASATTAASAELATARLRPRRARAPLGEGRARVAKAVWLGLVSLYFVIPLAATAAFSLEGEHGSYTISAYTQILSSSAFSSAFLLSLRLAIETIVLAVVLVVPTAYWVRLRLPKLRPVMEALSFGPFVVSPVVLAVGVENVFRKAPSWFIGSPNILVVLYVVLSFPFLYRALDAGLRAIDVHTLTEAARSLGAGWALTLWRVILPNLRTAIISGALLAFAIVMGEFTIASLLLFNTFGVYIETVGMTAATGAAALALISFALTWLAMGGLVLVLGKAGGGKGSVARQVQIGVTR